MNRLFINKEWSPLKKLLFMNAASGGSLNEYTATGNPVSFNTNVAKPMSQLLIPFIPVQSGSGDPSPENVRPITGWTGVDVTVNGTTIPVTFPAEAGTVYGGTLDLTTGVLTMTDASVIIDGSEGNWSFASYGTSVNRMNAYAPEVLGFETSRNNVLFSYVKTSTSESVWCGYISGTNNIIVRTPSDVIASKQDWLDYIGTNPLQICCGLAEPLEYQLTPQQIQTLIGDNVIFTSTNGQNTVKYLKKG